MGSDIVFDRDGDSAITLVAERVHLTGRLNLPRIDAAKPPKDGEVGDVVVTVEEVRNDLLNTFSTATRLWLCVPASSPSVQGVGIAVWREIQLGAEVNGV
jgi:hypothetical protein